LDGELRIYVATAIAFSIVDFGFKKKFLFDHPPHGPFPSREGKSVVGQAVETQLKTIPFDAKKNPWHLHLMQRKIHGISESKYFLLEGLGLFLFVFLTKRNQKNTLCALCVSAVRIILVALKQPRYPIHHHRRCIPIHSGRCGVSSHAAS
jgi:hypothetical protein